MRAQGATEAERARRPPPDSNGLDGGRMEVLADSIIAARRQKAEDDFDEKMDRRTAVLNPALGSVALAASAAIAEAEPASPIHRLVDMAKQLGRQNQAVANESDDASEEAATGPQAPTEPAKQEKYGPPYVNWPQCLKSVVDYAALFGKDSDPTLTPRMAYKLHSMARLEYDNMTSDELPADMPPHLPKVARAYWRSSEAWRRSFQAARALG